MEYREELSIAKKAEQMLTSALRNRTQSFQEHYHKKDNDKSLKEVEAKASFKEYGQKKEGNQHVFMRSLAIIMPSHGFVQHYGVDTIRKGGDRKRNLPRSITYHYGGHYFKMKATPFISQAIKDSGVVEFVAENIGKVRAERFGEELFFNLSYFTKHE